MPKDLPSTPADLIAWTWPEIEPHFKDLESRSINQANVKTWLADWSRLAELLEELLYRLTLASAVNTADKAAEERLKEFLGGIYPSGLAAEQELKEKLLASKLEPEGFDIPLRNLRAEADLFREANLPLLGEEKKLAIEYGKIFGAQTVKWKGEEVTLTRLCMVFEEPDRDRREKAWHLIADRQLADRKAVNELWQKFMHLRARIAANAGKPSFREFAWQQKMRFDYTPDDC
jgi:oligoendopeptidase F